jgi:predicted DNA-binding protein YlxM (UPF0122 family)
LPSKTRKALSPKQLLAIDLLVYSDLTHIAVSKQVGISETTLYQWLKHNVAFLEAYNLQRQSYRAMHGKGIDRALIQSASNPTGKSSAIDRRLYYQLQKEILQDQAIVPVQIMVGDLYRPDAWVEDTTENKGNVTEVKLETEEKACNMSQNAGKHLSETQTPKPTLTGTYFQLEDDL